MIKLYSSIYLFAALLATRAYAIGGSGVTLENPLAADSIQELISDVLDIIIQVGMPLLVLVFIFIGFKFVMARGNPEELKVARQWFLWAVVGAAIVLGAYVIAVAIQGTINQIKG